MRSSLFFARTPPRRPSTASMALAAVLLSRGRPSGVIPPAASLSLELRRRSLLSVTEAPRRRLAVAAPSASPSTVVSTSRNLTLQPLSIECKQRAMRLVWLGVAPSSFIPLGSSPPLVGST